MKKTSITRRVLGLCMASALCGGLLLSGMPDGITAHAAGDMHVVYNVNLPEDTEWPADGEMPKDTEADADTGKAVVGDDPKPAEIQSDTGKWYAFTGWQPEGTEKLLQRGDTVEFDVDEPADQRTILYAQWDTAKRGVTVLFVTEDGKEVPNAAVTVVVEKGGAYDVTDKAKELPKGYVANGDIVGDLTGTADGDVEVKVPVKPDGSVTEKVTITVKFVDDGGREIKGSELTMSVDKGSEYDATALTKQMPTGYAPNGDLKGDALKGTADGDKTITVPLKPCEQTELFITISGNTATVPYNGKEQSVSGYTMEVKDKDGNRISLPDGIGVAPDGTKYVAKGTEISDDAYMMGIDVMDLELTGEDTWKYRPTFTVYDGWVKVVTGSGLTAKADSVSATYDGKEHPVTVNALVNGEPTSGATATVVYRDGKGAVVDGVPKDAGNYKAEIKVSQQGFEDVAFVTSVTIKKAGLTVKTEGATKEYDGNALKNGDKATVTGAVGTEKVTIEATGSQTEVGTSKNTYRLAYSDGAKESNYEVVKEDLGVLTVNKKPVANQNQNNQNQNNQNQGNSQNVQSTNKPQNTTQNTNQNTTDVKGETVKTADTSYPTAVFAFAAVVSGLFFVLYTKREDM